jgi:hypothetical protein
MNGKMIVGIGLIAGIVAIAFLSAPIQAYVNRTDNGDLLQVQDRDRLRTRDSDCNCTCDRTQEQNRTRQRNGECITNRICNCTMNSEQYRYKNRERTSLGH